MTFAAVPTGLQNPGFEDGLNDWTVSVRDSVYDPAEPADCRVPDGICLITGSDSFTVRDDVYSTRTETVAPVAGNKMVRLAGPFNDSSQRQPTQIYSLEQTFAVDPANPVLQLAFNVFTFDYLGYDQLEFRVTLTDSSGEVITSREQGGFSSGVSLKTTGWQPAYIDLSGYEGQQVHLRIEGGGTRDTLYGFWAYVDAGLVPTPPVGAPEAEPVSTPSGQQVAIVESSSGGQQWFSIPTGIGSAGGPADFPNGCMPLTLNVPIDAGGGSVSNAKLLFDKNPGGVETFDMHDTPPSPADGTWTGTIDCVADGSLSVAYDLTEDGVTQHFVVPIGGLVLIDPQGIVHDKEKYDAEIAGGKSPEQARAAAALAGAKVELQRCTSASGGCVKVLSGDPGISPKVNPQTTGSNGLYQWDVADGLYRVVVTHAGYVPVTGPITEIPPPLLDGHIAMTKVKTDPPVDPGTPNNNTGGDNKGEQPPPQQQQPQQQQPQIPAEPKPPCAGLKGTKLKACKDKQALAAAIAKCNKIKSKSRRKACVTKAKALAKCNKLTGKKRAACRKKASAPPKKR